MEIPKLNNKRIKEYIQSQNIIEVMAGIGRHVFGYKSLKPN